MENYLTKELIKDKELSGVIFENSIIKELLLGDVPILLCGENNAGKVTRLKDIILSSEEVLLNSVHDLSGISTVVFDQEKFDSMKYMIDNKEISYGDLVSCCKKFVNDKPMWLENLEARCSREPNRLHALIFSEIEKASYSVLRQLSDIVENRMIDGKWKLPVNARVVLVGNKVKKDDSALENLYKRTVAVGIETSIESWLKLRNLEDVSSGLEFKISDVYFNSDLLAYVLCKFWRDKEDVLGISNNINKLCVVSKLMDKFDKEEILNLFMKREFVEEFFCFSNRKIVDIDDIINENYFKENNDFDVSREVLMYFRICSEKDSDKRKRASKKFVQYDCENNGLLLVDLYFWSNMRNDEKLLNFMDLAKKTTMQRLFERNDSKKLNK